jgi:aldose 1-epimerase
MSPRDDGPGEVGTTLVPLSGLQYRIAASAFHATITEVGATLRSFTADGIDVVDGFPLDEMSTAGRGQILAPWPNRLADGRFSADGHDATAALDEPSRGNAIHGLVRWLPWRHLSGDDSAVVLGCVLHPQPGYPWRLALQVAYALDGDGLTVTTTAENRSDLPAPFGIGFHPYVTLGTGIDEAFLTIPAASRLRTDERGLPTTEEPVAGSTFDFTNRRQIGATQLDTAYSELERGDDGRVRVVLEDRAEAERVTVWADREFHHLMVYTGDTLEPVLRRRRGIAIEPMTCPPNALATGSGVIRLQPGGSWTASWGIAKEGSHAG